ncbi:5'-3' exonuclease PLD4 isoform X3 [Bos javanicus]|uniref:5'-3' exonuclease PLD4 isoform X3 n=1 Tax=Bos javanicus TaxID=9906 RepID=UPI002AA6959E|nr:5'-3' exonuclease PLD4 isoform X3 [Bos javanicus]
MDSTPSGQARVRVTWARNRVCRVPTRWPPRCPAARECGVTTPRPRAAGDAGHPAQGLRPLLHTGGPGVARLHTALWPAGEGSQHCESGGPQEGLSRHTGPPGQSGRGRRSHEGPGLPAQGLLAPVWRTREHVQPPGRGLRPALASPSWRQGWSVSGECGPRDPGGVFLQLQVRGTLVLLCLGAVTLTCLLGLRSSPSAWSQGCPEEGPARPGGLGSRVDWDPRGREARRRHQQKDSCRLVLVESIPQDLRSVAGSPAAQPLAQAWMQLLDAARESVHVASFYWSLTGPDIGVNDSSSQPGEALLQKLQQLLDRNVSLAVATSTPTPAKNSTDLQVLESRGAQVRHVPMGKLTGGVLHSKFWVVDGRHIYVGSANMDWRSLTQVKELGAVIYNCSRLAQDLEKTFQTYWVLGTPRAVLPKPWPQNFSSHINRFQPLRDHFDGVPTTVYFSASPPALCPHGRTRDLDALLAVMGAAREFLYASVMEYFPTTRFRHPASYWPVLDTALRVAAFSRGVRVRLLVSCWLNTDPRMFPFLRSLQALSNPAANVSMDVKVFIVPVGNHSNIPFSRVNHSKFMVTEKAAYIGTSNWSEDYFSSTSGVGLVVSQRASGAQPGVSTVQEQLRQLFERDWSSRYAVGLDGQAQGQDCVWQG